MRGFVCVSSRFVAAVSLVMVGAGACGGGSGGGGGTGTGGGGNAPGVVCEGAAPWTTRGSAQVMLGPERSERAQEGA
jgi:hypothetical protein